MIIILTGPTGVGKTDTSWALIEQFQQLVFLDADWFASRVPFSWSDKNDVASVYEAIFLMIDYHLRHSCKNFVIPIPIQMAEQFEGYKEKFLDMKLPICAVRLRCSEQELERRITERNRVSFQKQEELSAMREHQKTFDALFPDDTVFSLLDTTLLSEKDVAKKIVELAKRNSS